MPNVLELHRKLQAIRRKVNACLDEFEFEDDNAYTCNTQKLVGDLDTIAGLVAQARPMAVAELGVELVRPKLEAPQPITTRVRRLSS